MVLYRLKVKALYMRKHLVAIPCRISYFKFRCRFSEILAGVGDGLVTKV